MEYQTVTLSNGTKESFAKLLLDGTTVFVCMSEFTIASDIVRIFRNPVDEERKKKNILEHIGYFKKSFLVDLGVGKLGW